MSKKEPNMKKTLKHLGLIPNKKKYETMKIVGIYSSIVFILLLSIFGAYKYPLNYNIIPDNGYGLPLSPGVFHTTGSLYAT